MNTSLTSINLYDNKIVKIVDNFIRRGKGNRRLSNLR